MDSTINAVLLFQQGVYTMNQSQSAANIINHIQSRYHSRILSDLEELLRLGNDVLSAEYSSDEEKEKAKNLFNVLGDFKKEIGEHLVEEDEDIFPAIVALEEALTKSIMLERDNYLTILNSINKMEQEHKHVAAVSGLFRDLTGDYNQDNAINESQKEFFTLLQKFEKDLFEHIRVEMQKLRPVVVGYVEDYQGFVAGAREETMTKFGN